MFNTSKVTLFVLALFAAGGASAQAAGTTVQVPDKLKPGANESLATIVHAKGVQIYECRSRKDQPGDYEWAFVAPEAELFDATGNRIGRHYAGPSWEAADGSKIQGTPKERADAPAADAIPWLVAQREVGRRGRRVQQGHERAARKYCGRRGPQGRLLASRGRNTRAHQLHGGILLFHQGVNYPIHPGRGASHAESQRMTVV